MKLVKTPYLQLPTTDGMTVMWETDESGDSTLMIWNCYVPGIPNTYKCEYRPEGGATLFHGADGKMHSVTATGLQPSTDYCYQIKTRCRDGEITSDILVFRTAPKAGTAYRIGLIAETGGAYQPQNTPPLVHELTLNRPDFVMFMGDAVWDGNVEEDWEKYFFAPFRELFSTTPFYHVMGNHDAEGRELAARYMQAPPVNSFVYGDARFIILDSTRFAKRTDKGDDSSEMRAFDTFTENDPEWKFLIQELEKQDTVWTFVCFHYPPYASALFEAPCMRRLCPVMDKYHVDAVFTSHTIHYERSLPLKNGIPDSDGTVYFIIGGVGDYNSWVHHKTLPVTAAIMPKPHFATLEVSPFSLELKAYDSNGALFDMWSKKK